MDLLLELLGELPPVPAVSIGGLSSVHDDRGGGGGFSPADVLTRSTGLDSSSSGSGGRPAPGASSGRPPEMGADQENIPPLPSTSGHAEEDEGEDEEEDEDYDEEEMRLALSLSLGEPVVVAADEAVDEAVDEVADEKSASGGGGQEEGFSGLGSTSSLVTRDLLQLLLLPPRPDAGENDTAGADGSGGRISVRVPGLEEALFAPSPTVRRGEARLLLRLFHLALQVG